MLLLLNTTKTMDIDATVPPRLKGTEPRHLEQASMLLVLIQPSAVMHRKGYEFCPAFTVYCAPSILLKLIASKWVINQSLEKKKIWQHFGKKR